MPISDTFQIFKFDGDNKVLVWKHPVEDFSTMAQLIVTESQEAVFFKDGEAMDVFGPGRHTLETGNIPKIGKLLSLNTSGESIFKCSLYFVNKIQQMGIKWGGDVKFEDPVYKFPITIGVNGSLEISVKDSIKLIVKLIGMNKYFSRDNLLSQSEDRINNKVKNYLSKTIEDEKISVFSLDRNIGYLSSGIFENLKQDFNSIGIELNRFMLTHFQLPENDPDFIRYKNLYIEKGIGIQEKLVEKAKTLIESETIAETTSIVAGGEAEARRKGGYTYGQEQTYKYLQAMAENNGSGADFRNSALGLGTGFGMAGTLGAFTAGAARDALNEIAPPHGRDNNINGLENQTDDMPSMLKLKSEERESEYNPVQIRINNLKALKGEISEEEYNKKLNEILRDI